MSRGSVSCQLGGYNCSIKILSENHKANEIRIGNQGCNQFTENNLLAHTFGCETVNESAHSQAILVFHKIGYFALEYMATGLFYKDDHPVGSIKLEVNRVHES